MSIYLRSILLYSVFFVWSANVLTTQAQSDMNYSYDQAWKEFDSLSTKGLSRSAREVAEKIYAEAAEKENYPQYIKALIYISGIQNTVEEYSDSLNLKRFKEAYYWSKTPAKQLIASYLAEFYWNYYRQNRWRIIDRTPLYDVEGAIEQDQMEIWDAKTFHTVIHHWFESSLSKEDTTQHILVTDIKPLLSTPSADSLYRPTLYDLLIHRALEYYSNTESGLTSPKNAFRISANKSIVPSSEFITWNPQTTDTLSKDYCWIKSFQKLLLFHQERIKRKQSDGLYALIDADIARLTYLKNHSVGSNKDTLYLSALEALANEHSDHPAIASVYHLIAELYNERGNLYDPFEPGKVQFKWDKKRAKEICEQTEEQFPGSRGAEQCRVLVQSIEENNLSLSIEDANLPDTDMRFLLTYKNVSKAFFRIIPYDEKIITLRNQKSLAEWLSNQTPVLSWDVALKGIEDFQQHRTEIPMDGMNPGRYLMLVSDDEDFSTENKAVVYAEFQVTDLAMIWENRDLLDLEFYVLDRKNGQPLPNVTAELFEWNYKNQSYSRRGKKVLTDEEGFAALKGTSDAYQYKVVLTNGDDQFVSSTINLYDNNYQPDQRLRKHLHFFTDRKIYRPGQTIYFKAIALQGENENTTILPNSSFTFDLLDVNYQKIASQTLTTNEFGTVHGNFIAPSTGLLGNMTIRNEHGSTYISVEEYKRPTFEVVLNKVEGAYALGDNISMTGNAVTFSGVPLSEVEVRYNVIRKVKYPYWYGYFRFPYYPQEEQVIEQGITQTDNSGSFSIPFELTPDPNIDPATKPTFIYQVYAEVVDLTGETHQTTNLVEAAYDPLIVSVEVPEYTLQNTAPELIIKAINFSGKKERIQGTISVSALKKPSRFLRERKWERPDEHILTKEEYVDLFPNDIYGAEDQYINWDVSDPLGNFSFDTEEDSTFLINELVGKEAGWYKISVQANDPQLELIKYIELRASSDTKIDDTFIFHSTVNKTTAQPGDMITYQVAGGMKEVWVLYTLSHRGGEIERRWYKIKKKPVTINIPVKEEYRGNIFASFQAVHHNTIQQSSDLLSIPWTNKQLQLSWETFRSNLKPGQEEHWTLTIKGPASETVAAELVATLYDASLDEFRANQFNLSIFDYNTYYSPWNSTFEVNRSRLINNNWSRNYRYPASIVYPQLIRYSSSVYLAGLRTKASREGVIYQDRTYSRQDAIPGVAMNMLEASPKEELSYAAEEGSNINVEDNEILRRKERDDDAPPPPAEENKADLSQIDIRKNFNETAFFLPDLKTNESGEVLISFQMPEALTRWKFLGLAHTKDLQIGQIESSAITQKELMIRPVLPRFVRENDTMVLSAKVSNLTDKSMKGNADIRILNAFNMQPIDDAFGVKPVQQAFELEGKENKALQWNIYIPESYQAIVIQFAAKAGDFSDGEEHVLPVLKNRMLVTEAFPLSVKGSEEKELTFNRLVNANSSTLQHHRFTLEFTPNPAWYAVQALPYLMEFPHECTEQIFSRFYANSLASHIANQHPSVKHVFEQWTRSAGEGNETGLISQLEKNQELKEVFLSETPWVLQAQDENKRKERIGVLFDLHRMAKEQSRALSQLSERQLNSGAFSWFPGMRENRYITQLIVEGLGSLQKLGINSTGNPEVSRITERAIPYLDDQIRQKYQRLLDSEVNMSDKHITYLDIQYLFMRSFFRDMKVGEDVEEAYRYFYQQAQQFWVEQPYYLQSLLAMTFHRSEDAEVAEDILASLRENAIYSDEMGMYWKNAGDGFYWYDASIEMQAKMIEAFDEISGDRKEVDEMKIWLLKQKQTQDWKTTRATVAACNAIMTSGTDWLNTTQNVQIKLGEEVINITSTNGNDVEAGTGYVKKSWMGTSVVPELGNISIAKQGEGIAWGAAYWQYFEQLDKIEQGGNELGVSKKIYLVSTGDGGEELVELDSTTQLKVGDKIKIRLSIQSERNLEYVHIKDQRAASMEPISVLSTYKYQGGLGYYESNKDAATHFFLDYLPAGKHVFEYPLRVVHSGTFSGGISTIQCMYAPEFTSHSKGERMNISK